jgi:hypothetical protein
MQRRTPPKGRRDGRPQRTQVEGCYPCHRDIDDNGAKRLQRRGGLNAVAAAIAKRCNGAALGYGNGKASNMTKQHFIALAAEIKQISDIEARAEAARAVAAVARQFNPRFDWMKFNAACGV